ncbi:hypothetical protein TEA_008776 [Camellia sinensis var. sinensis]|uniref:LSM domain-containing protein n=1 Tax=Camellia sinensis var. sinensis TaxID=542762 RepID=A0A4S4D641_CAMSN|nr:hypothetical protein TEA_008776 [Camellia sinensis var. sinensis]
MYIVARYCIIICGYCSLLVVTLTIVSLLSCSAEADGKVSQLEHVFIRGSKVRFMVIPDMLKNAPIFKRLESRIKGKGSAIGVGRGRAVAMRARAQAAGRGAPPGRGAVPSIRSHDRGTFALLACILLAVNMMKMPLQGMSSENQIGRFIKEIINSYVD